jgi:hypothetical protein
MFISRRRSNVAFVSPDMANQIEEGADAQRAHIIVTIYDEAYEHFMRNYVSDSAMQTDAANKEAAQFATFIVNRVYTRD